MYSQGDVIRNIINSKVRADVLSTCTMMYDEVYVQMGLSHLISLRR